MRNLLFLLCVAAQVFGQGIIIFNNRGLYDPAQEAFYDARVTLPNGQGAEGSAFTAGLFLIQDGELSLLKTTTFRSGIAAGYFLPVEAVVPGIPALSPATFRVRVWETDAGSYDSAVASGMLRGEFVTGQTDNSVFVPRLGPYPGPLGGAPYLDGIQPLTLVPEPTILALVTLGAFASFALRKRRAVRKLPQ